VVTDQEENIMARTQNTDQAVATTMKVVANAAEAMMAGATMNEAYRAEVRRMVAAGADSTAATVVARAAVRVMATMTADPDADAREAVAAAYQEVMP
jgi:hypothetical protein